MRRFAFILFMMMLASLLYAQIKKDSSRSEMHMNKITHHVFDSTKVVGSWPTYPGGKKALDMFIKKEMKYPDEAKKKKEEGWVVVNCMVDTLGKILATKVIKSLSPSLDHEALRIVSKMPQIIPARALSGKNIESAWTVAIPFKLDDISLKINGR